MVIARSTKLLVALVAIPSLVYVFGMAKNGMNFSRMTGDFSGDYADPNHPNCRRQIRVSDDANENKNKNGVVVSGTDGNPGCPPDGSGEQWSLMGFTTESEIVVDFSPKGGPKNLEGTKIPGGILWKDGNVWTNKATPNRRKA